MARVDEFNVPYPDFRPGERIESEKVDLNNKKIVDKVNEVITEINLADVRLDTHKESGDHDERYLLRTDGGNVLDVVAGMREEVTQIVKGSANAEVSQARVGQDNKTYTTLKERLDTEIRKKNTVFHGATTPTGASTSDLWFKPLASGQLQMHIYNGTAWIPQTYSAESLKGTLSGSTVALTDIDANNIVSNREAFFKQTLSSLNPHFTFEEYGVLIDKGMLTIGRNNSFKTIDKGVPGFEFPVIGNSPPFMSTNVIVSGVNYRTNSTNPENLNYYSVKHDARYFKVTATLSADNPIMGARLTIVNNGSIVLASQNHYEAAEKTYTLTLDMGEPTGEVVGFYIRLNSGADSSYAQCRLFRVWKEG